MQITLYKIAFGKPDYHPAYVVEDLRDTHRICELLNTQNTVWSLDEIEQLGAMAARGEFDMMNDGHRVTITFKSPGMGDCEDALADHKRLVRELDVLLNGEEGAAKQASLCDIVAQLKNEKSAFLFAKHAMTRLGIHVPASVVFTETEMTELLEFARVALQDGEFFDRMCLESDLEDEYVLSLRDKLSNYMSTETV